MPSLQETETEHLPRCTIASRDLIIAPWHWEDTLPVASESSRRTELPLLHGGQRTGFACPWGSIDLLRLPMRLNSSWYLWLWQVVCFL